ncbi:hypothetical protein HHI36_005099 [Cryptolaemus montrouzieri]|uniref:Uncharacterized protein n=1 Tax=Cryptolaemus montrouzieri TaxID=559131 RepID=A0ABD2NTJ9_9CUCU
MPYSSMASTSGHQHDGNGTETLHMATILFSQRPPHGDRLRMKNLIPLERRRKRGDLIQKFKNLCLGDSPVAQLYTLNDDERLRGL